MRLFGVGVSTSLRLSLLLLVSSVSQLWWIGQLRWVVASLLGACFHISRALHEPRALLAEVSAYCFFWSCLVTALVLLFLNWVSRSEVLVSLLPPPLTFAFSSFCWSNSLLAYLLCCLALRWRSLVCLFPLHCHRFSSWFLPASRCHILLDIESSMLAHSIWCLCWCDFRKAFARNSVRSRRWARSRKNWNARKIFILWNKTYCKPFLAPLG